MNLSRIIGSGCTAGTTYRVDAVAGSERSTDRATAAMPRRPLPRGTLPSMVLVIVGGRSVRHTARESSAASGCRTPDPAALPLTDDAATTATGGRCGGTERLPDLGVKLADLRGQLVGIGGRFGGAKLGIGGELACAVLGLSTTACGYAFRCVCGVYVPDGDAWRGHRGSP
jgi:hypothetical protein